MKISRRALLAGAAIITTIKPSTAWRHGKQLNPTTPVVVQGAMSGGGFDGMLDIANDGSTVLGYDGANLWKWNAATGQFDNIFAQGRLPTSPTNWNVWGGQSDANNVVAPSTKGVAQAPSDSNVIYAVPQFGNNFGGADLGSYTWKSTNGGNSWTDLNYRFALSTQSPRSSQNQVSVDPNNPNVVYISDQAGVIHRSVNGGATWARLYSEFGLPSAVATVTRTANPFTFGGGVPALVKNFTVTGAADNGAGLVRLTFADTTGLVSDEYYTVSAVGGVTGANGNRKITVVNSTTVDLQNTTFGGTYTSGGTMRTAQLVYVSDPSNTTSTGITVVDRISSTTDTTVTLLTNLGNANQITSGDTIVFGNSAFICFDPSAGTTSTTVDGQSVTVTKNIYIGWRYGASAVYASTNGGVNWSATVGGPARVLFMACSSDGVLYVCDEKVPTVVGTDLNNLWRYVGGVAPGGSGLSINTWTHFAQNSGSERFYGVAADPLNPGHVMTMSAPNIDFGSADWGQTWVKAHTNSYRDGGTDTPWLGQSITNIISSGAPNNYCRLTVVNTANMLEGQTVKVSGAIAAANGSWPIHIVDATHIDLVGSTFSGVFSWTTPGNVEGSGTLENSMSCGKILFDPVTSSRIWFAEGVGLWYGASTPGTTISLFQWNSRNKNQQGLIVECLRKPPGQPLIVSVQDRIGMTMFDPTQSPYGDCGIGNNIGVTIRHSFGYDYAKDGDPSVGWMAVTTTIGLWKTTNGGRSWTQMVASGNVGQGPVCVQTGNNFVAWQQSGSQFPFYSTDGGATVNNCLFAGSTMAWPMSGQMAQADPNDINTYWAYKVAASGSNGGLWKSTDSGANWTRVSTPPTGASTIHCPDASLICIPGFPGHLFLTFGGWITDGTGKLFRTTDGGASWTQVATSGRVWQVAAGKAAIGASYPTIFITGTTSTDSDPGLWYCNDFTSGGGGTTWNRMSRAPAGNNSFPSCLEGDWDTYGNVYVGMDSVGFTFGRLT